MPGYIKVWIKMIIDFVFSVSIIVAVIAYSLLGTLTKDNLRILIVDESVEGELTGAEAIIAGHKIFEGNIPAYLMRNFLWFTIFIAIFCLVVLYFMEPRLKVFLFPGSLCFLSVLFIQVAMMIMNSFISPDTPILTTEYLALAFNKANQASLMAAGAGMILLIASNFNLYQVMKKKADSK